VVDCTKEVVREALKVESTAEVVGDIWAVDAINAVGSDAEKAVYAAFEPHMDEYLDDETEWIKNVLDKMCKAWDAKVSELKANCL
jgi:recyclin-1